MSYHEPQFRIARACGAIALLSLGACAVNPATGGRMFSLVSEGQEIEMGQQYMAEVDAGMGLYGDSALQAYVDSVGQALAAVSERPDLPWSFKIVDDPVINAFALPGGPVYVARGIMAYFNSEAEMASVLGHEIGHITARHSVEQISRAQLMQVGLVAGVVLVPQLRPFGDVLGGGLGVLFLKFGRDDESQSDELGFRYMTRLGYDPQGAVDMFEILERQREASGGSIPEWQSTHPDPGNRVIAAQQRLAESQIEGGIVRRDEYLRHVDGLLFGEDPAQGFFVEGFRIAATELSQQPELAAWSPGGAFVALALAKLPEATLRQVHRFAWWFHALTAFAFIAYFVFGKFSHVVFGLANVFFRNLGPSGKLHYADIDALAETDPEALDHLGVDRIEQLSWKSLLDLDACVNCGRCEAVCPALAITIESEQRADGTRRTTRYDIDLFKCIYCGFCEESCPVDSIVETRIFEYHFEKRGENIMNKQQLLAIGDQYEKQIAADRAQDAAYR